MSGAGTRAAIERAAQARADAIRTGVKAAVEAFPGVTARLEGDDVVIEGRDLLHRWLNDARFRNAARDTMEHGQ